jgi:outer membrane protein
MNKLNSWLLGILMLMGCLVHRLSLNAQSLVSLRPAELDSLTLQEIETRVQENHPVIMEAEESVNQAEAQIGLAKTGFYPDVNASANFSNVGPVPSLTVPDLGTFQLFPDNNINAGLDIRQNIYDFGKTSSRVAYSSANKDLQEKSLDAARQELAINVVKNFYMILYLQEAIRIKQEQLDILEQHLELVKKKKATGSGTDYEILSTQVNLSAVENQRLNLEAGLVAQLSILNSLLGLPPRTYHAVKETFNFPEPALSGDSVVSYALAHRDEMQIALKKNNLAVIRLNEVRARNHPSLDFIAQGGWKNGYVPDINKVRPNYVIGLGLQIPVFDANKLKYNILIAESSIKSSSFEAEVTRREISSEVVKNESNLRTAEEKVQQTDLLLRQAEEAYELAETSFSAGAITNLDLLDASSNVSESKLASLRSRVDYAISLYLLKASLGEKIY